MRELKTRLGPRLGVGKRPRVGGPAFLIRPHPGPPPRPAPAVGPAPPTSSGLPLSLPSRAACNCGRPQLPRNGEGSR